LQYFQLKLHLVLVKKNNGINLGFVFFSQLFASFLGMYALILLREQVGWVPMTLFMGGLCVISLILSITYKRPVKNH